MAVHLSGAELPSCFVSGLEFAWGVGSSKEGTCKAYIYVDLKNHE